MIRAFSTWQPAASIVTKPAVAFTFTDDVMEIWWSPDRPGPDGKPGVPFYVANGKRYALGQWPATDAAPFRDDGSPQPPRDPDQ